MKVSLLQEKKDWMEDIIRVRYTDLERERDSCVSLLEIAEREKDVYATAFAYTYLGDYHIAQNDTEKCGYYLQKARLLCLENGYADLLLRIYNLLGICYEALSDEQTALQFYLRALEVASQHRNPDIECIIINNIASNFEIMEEYEEAKKYYLQACELMMQTTPDLPNLEYIRLRVWGNIAEVCRALGELDQMKTYLLNCEELSDEVQAARVCVLSRGWCGYYAGTGQTQKAVQAAEELLEFAVSGVYADKYLTYEMLICSCQTVISLQEKECAKRLLDYILGLRCEGEVDRLQQIQELNTKYYEMFGSPQEKSHAYGDYYQVMDQAKKSMKQAKANGFKNILYLDQIKNTLVSETRDLTEEAHLDELTQLYNRRYFNKLISKVVSSPDTERLGFVMIDVDYFKEYNDTYGHAKGDVVLQSVAQVFADCVPKQTTASRYGGDEFVCLCINQSQEEIWQFVKRLQAKLSALKLEHRTSHCAQEITLSIGFSSQNWTIGQSTDGLLDQADQALYVSKNAGRNTATCWQEKAEAKKE